MNDDKLEDETWDQLFENCKTQAGIIKRLEQELETKTAEHDMMVYLYEEQKQELEKKNHMLDVICVDCERIKELGRYKALKEFECNIPDNNLDGCAGDCVQYINNKFRICIYLKLKEFEEESNGESQCKKND